METLHMEAKTMSSGRSGGTINHRKRLPMDTVEEGLPQDPVTSTGSERESGYKKINKNWAWVTVGLHIFSIILSYILSYQKVHPGYITIFSLAIGTWLTWLSFILLLDEKGRPLPFLFNCLVLYGVSQNGIETIFEYLVVNAKSRRYGWAGWADSAESFWIQFIFRFIIPDFIYIYLL